MFVGEGFVIVGLVNNNWLNRTCPSEYTMYLVAIHDYATVPLYAAVALGTKFYCI